MQKQRGFSIIELLIVVAIILIIAAIAIPSLLRAKMASNDSAAVATLRTVNTSQATYATSYPRSGYAGLWTQLGPAAPGTPCTAAADCLLDQWVACGIGGCPKEGYTFFLNDGAGGTGVGPNPPAGAAPDADFAVSASPLLLGNSGDQNICSYSDAVVRSSKKASPPVILPPALPATGETAAGCNTLASYGPI